MKSHPRKGAKDAHPKPSPQKKRCPNCGRLVDTLIYPIHPLPGEDPAAKDRPLVCPDCAPKPPDETKS
jgi:hypothetical protein